eukprot:1868551-Amphidinium_carterae.1
MLVFLEVLDEIKAGYHDTSTGNRQKAFATDKRSRCLLLLEGQVKDASDEKLFVYGFSRCGSGSLLLVRQLLLTGQVELFTCIGRKAVQSVTMNVLQAPLPSALQC